MLMLPRYYYLYQTYFFYFHSFQWYVHYTETSDITTMERIKSLCFLFAGKKQIYAFGSSEVFIMLWIIAEISKIANALIVRSSSCAFSPKHIKNKNTFHDLNTETSLICTEILALQPFPQTWTGSCEYTIQFAILRDSRSAYLGRFCFVLPRYSCHGITRSGIQVSFRERSGLLPLLIAIRRHPRYPQQFLRALLDHYFVANLYFLNTHNYSR